MLLLLLACTGKTDDSGDPVQVGDVAVLTDQNNYAISGSIDVPSVVTASGVDVEICWDQVFYDL